MSTFTFIAASKEQYSDDINFALHDGFKNVNTKYKPESTSSYGGKDLERFVIGKITVYRNLEFTCSGLTHMAEIVYAVIIARFLWKQLDNYKLTYK